jgi:spore maturation protein CgeB
MKPQELRIGNIVLRNGFLLEHKDKYEQIIVSHNDITACVVDNSSFKPIPLTEEWILKFGFISNAYKDRYELKNIHIECDKTNGFTDLWIEKMPHIKYVHQLQSLYFFLCGEELTIIS